MVLYLSPFHAMADAFSLKVTAETLHSRDMSALTGLFELQRPVTVTRLLHGTETLVLARSRMEIEDAFVDLVVKCWHMRGATSIMAQVLSALDYRMQQGPKIQR